MQRPREVVLATIKRARQAGESQEMLARWVCEDLHRAGFAVVPISATPEMTKAANQHVAVVTPDGTWSLARDEASRAWTSMVEVSHVR